MARQRGLAGPVFGDEPALRMLNPRKGHREVAFSFQRESRVNRSWESSGPVSVSSGRDCGPGEDYLDRSLLRVGGRDLSDRDAHHHRGRALGQVLGFPFVSLLTGPFDASKVTVLVRSLSRTAP